MDMKVQRKRERMQLEKLSAIEAKAEEEFDLLLEKNTRAGEKYDKIVAWLTETGQLDGWIDQTGISNADVAKRWGVTAQAVGRYRKHAFNERIRAKRAEGWQPKPEHAAMLGPSDSDMAQLAADDAGAFERKLDELVQAFVDWRDEFFQVGVETKYITRPMHRRWIKSVLRTIYTGGRSLILSPPRHGKTDLLIHFCVWVIVRNPEIRILWVGPNGDIAENSLGQVANILEGHEQLREAYLPPGGTWRPGRRGGGNLWQRQKFTVATRTVFKKQPTMWCTGVGGKILSLDCDFIIVDDPADPDDSQTPGGRDKIDKWFKIKLATRKMHHTGLAMISSRVHPDDLYSQYIDSDRWTSTVDMAHNRSVCGLDLFDDHSGLDDPDACVLFPEVNPLEYLQDQHETVGEALFEMMYLNQPRPDGTMIFDIDRIEQVCLDRSRGLGTAELGVNYRLVAGLDPASRGVQAAFLWAVALPTEGNPRDPRNRAVDDTTYFKVDMETQKAGGPDGAHRIMRHWYEKYGVTLWVIEDNAYQDVFFDDPRTKQLERELGLTIRPTHTGKNKHDPHFGVAGMAPLFHDGHVNLPYGTPEARRSTDRYLRQLSDFTGDTNKTGSRKYESDILMASWFPHSTVIRKWRRDARHAMVKAPVTASYPNYMGPSYGATPWTTNYPTT